MQSNGVTSETSGTRLLTNGTTVASVIISAGTITSGNIGANNCPLVPASYTFISTQDRYMNIFSAQCDRVGAFIYNKIDQLDRSDDDYNEVIVDSIADVIDLVGEPAYYTASLEAKILQEDAFAFERLLLAIASARHKETEDNRLQLLQQYAENSDPRVRRAAVRALSRMKSEGARKALQQIAAGADQGELTRLATAFLR
jgi:hypothetical protein